MKRIRNSTKQVLSGKPPASAAPPRAEQLFCEGLQCRFGIDRSADSPLALRLFEQAGQMGHGEALYQAAQMLAYGEGVPFDRRRAFAMTKEAAARGVVEAIYSLGFYYMNGGMGNLGYSDEVLSQIKIRRNEPKALALYSKAARLGFGLAMYRLGEYWQSQSRWNRCALIRAASWFARGAEAGEPSCMVEFGDMCYFGLGIPRDRSKARRLYNRAAASGDAEAEEAARLRIAEFEDLSGVLTDKCSDSGRGSLKR